MLILALAEVRTRLPVVSVTSPADDVMPAAVKAASVEPLGALKVNVPKLSIRRGPALPNCRSEPTPIRPKFFTFAIVFSYNRP